MVRDYKYSYLSCRNFIKQNQKNRNRKIHNYIAIYNQTPAGLLDYTKSTII